LKPRKNLKIQIKVDEELYAQWWQFVKGKGFVTQERALKKLLEMARAIDLKPGKYL